jgi:hypothetical protein
MFSLLQPVRFSDSQSKCTARASCLLKACAASSSSVSSKAGQSKPMALASRRKISVFGFASPSGAIAALFAIMYRWP